MTNHHLNENLKMLPQARHVFREDEISKIRFLVSQMAKDIKSLNTELIRLSEKLKETRIINYNI